MTKYALCIATTDELSASDLANRPKSWLIKRVLWLQLGRKQMVTDHAMAAKNLSDQVQHERKQVQLLKEQLQKAEDTLSARQILLQKSVSDNHNKQQIIRKLGDSLALAGEAIAHL